MAGSDGCVFMGSRCTVFGVALFFVLSACSERPESSGPSGTAGVVPAMAEPDRAARDDTPAVAVAGFDACAVLPKAELERILGVTYQEGTAAGGSSSLRCSYLDANQRQLVSVEVYTKRGRVNMENMLEALSNEQVIPGIDADAAYTAGYGAIYLLDGDVYVEVLAQAANITPDKLHDLASVAARNFSQ
jgi:hypothetical protein